MVASCLVLVCTNRNFGVICCNYLIFQLILFVHYTLYLSTVFLFFVFALEKKSM